MGILFIATITLLFIWLESSEVEEESQIVINDYNSEKKIMEET